MRKSQELFSEFVERKKLFQAGEYKKTPFDSENRYLIIMIQIYRRPSMESLHIISCR